jgi:hypothetical protein
VGIADFIQKRNRNSRRMQVGLDVFGYSWVIQKMIVITNMLETYEKTESIIILWDFRGESVWMTLKRAHSVSQL